MAGEGIPSSVGGEVVSSASCWVELGIHRVCGVVLELSIGSGGVDICHVEQGLLIWLGLVQVGLL